MVGFINSIGKVFRIFLKKSAHPNQKDKADSISKILSAEI